MHRYKKIVITGANGFVAKHLRKYLSEKNIQLISISRNNFKKFKNELKIVLLILVISTLILFRRFFFNTFLKLSRKIHWRN